MKNFCVAVRIFVLLVIVGNGINAMDNDQDNSLKDKTETEQPLQKKSKDSEKIAFTKKGTESPIKVDKKSNMGFFSKDSNEVKVVFESGEEKKLSEVLAGQHITVLELKNDIQQLSARMNLLIASIKQLSKSNLEQDFAGRVERLEKTNATLLDSVGMNIQATVNLQTNNIAKPITSSQRLTQLSRSLVDTCTAVSASAALLYYSTPFAPLVTRYVAAVAQYGAASILPYVYIPASVLLLGTIGKEVYESSEQQKYAELSNSWENYFKTKEWLKNNTKPTPYFLKTALVYTACKNRCTYIANMAYNGLLTTAAAKILLSASTAIAGK